jgi:hypothetical protein
MFTGSAHFVTIPCSISIPNSLLLLLSNVESDHYFVCLLYKILLLLFDPFYSDNTTSSIVYTNSSFIP